MLLLKKIIEKLEVFFLAMKADLLTVVELVRPKCLSLAERSVESAIVAIGP